MRRRIQVVFQDPFSSLNPRMTVGRRDRRAAARARHRRPRRRAAAKVAELLDLVGLAPPLARRFPRELSGGQRQRVAIARSLAPQPELLIADEAVSALDVSIQAQILNLLVDLTERLGLTMIFISHQLSVIANVADDVAVMYLGRIVEHGPVDEVFEHPQHPYTAALLAANPEPVPERRRRQAAIRGDIPSPLDIPSGCRFRTRCAYAEARCAEVDPPAADVGPLSTPGSHCTNRTNISIMPALYGNHAPSSVRALGERAQLQWMQGRLQSALEDEARSIAWAERLGHLGQPRARNGFQPAASHLPGPGRILRYTSGQAGGELPHPSMVSTIIAREG